MGDRWTKPDCSKPAATWMRPLERGRQVDIVEFCGNWYLDDLPPMLFIKQSPNRVSFATFDYAASDFRHRFPFTG